MIYSDKQYAISAQQLGRLREALAASTSQEGGSSNQQHLLRKIQAHAIQSEIGILEADLSHYELLKAGEITFAKAHSLESLPSVLVQARIAAGLTQTDLAERLGMKAQQIQRYEASGYSGASLDRLIEVCEALNVRTTGIFETQGTRKGAVLSWSSINEVAWTQLPAREMAKRGWFDVPRGGDVHQLAREYFLKAAGPQFATALHRKKLHVRSTSNEYSLLAWQARILERAQKIVEIGNPPEFVANDQWLAELVGLTRHSDGPKRARDFLLSKGIILVVERHLSGTHLDGGAMLDRDGRPVIGLTLRFDRLDNFWFVLLHEIGHVFLHLAEGLHYDFFDEEETSGTDNVEREADNFALGVLIPEEKWNVCLSRFALSVEAVKIDAKNLGIDASIIAGRIRKERGDYTILSNLVGQGEVASQFEDDSNELV